MLDYGKYKNLDYWEFHYSSFSDSEKVDKEVITKIVGHKDFEEGATDVCLGLLSFARNRKSEFYEHDSGLHGDYQRKRIYSLHFTKKCIEIGYFGWLWYWFDHDYHFNKLQYIKC